MPTCLPTAPIVPVVLLDWKPIAKGALRGFAAVRLGRSLIIRDLAILHSNGRAWVGLPGKPIIGADGTAARDASGKQRYVTILEWSDRAAADPAHDRHARAPAALGALADDAP